MAPKLNISQQQRLQLKLSPQQVQYLKLLQLPVLALEQRIKTELDQNPLLEELVEEELELATQQEEERVEGAQELVATESKAETDGASEESYTIEDYMNDDTSGYKVPAVSGGDEDREEIPTPAPVSMAEHLTAQLHLLDLNEEELLLGEEIIGDIDEDGYLRRDLALILHDVEAAFGLTFTLEKAEEIRQKILYLDPPGIGSRSLKECLAVQLKAGKFDPEAKDLALVIV